MFIEEDGYPVGIVRFKTGENRYLYVVPIEDPTNHRNAYLVSLVGTSVKVIDGDRSFPGRLIGDYVHFRDPVTLNEGRVVEFSFHKRKLEPTK